MNDRKRGALLGLAVGDAVGTTYEFDRIAQPGYPTLATGPATDLVGGGPFGLEPGQVTDDTQMAICLARSLAAQRRLDPIDLAHRYVVWMDEAFDVGNQTRDALARVAAGASPWAAGLATWHARARNAAGNGSLMRTAPIAVALAASGDDAVIDAALGDSLITHADPRCAIAVAAFDVAIATAIRDGGDASAMTAAARRGVGQAARRLAGLIADHAGAPDAETIARARVELEGDLDAADADDPEVYGEAMDLVRTAGFVRVAFRLAFWHLSHTRSWRAAIVDVASRGGDADTNAAIVGALLGARDGAAAIPAAWIERVLAARQPGSEVWAADHHPRHLLALAE